MAINNLTYDPVQVLSIEAQEDLPAARFIYYDGNISSDGDEALGVSELDWNSGDLASVITIGVAIVETSEGFFAGDDVCVGSYGKAKQQAASEAVVGKALHDVSAGEYMRVLLIR